MRQSINKCYSNFLPSRVFDQGKYDNTPTVCIRRLVLRSGSLSLNFASQIAVCEFAARLHIGPHRWSLIYVFITYIMIE